MKYSFIMPYHKRHEQLGQTLNSLSFCYHDRDDYEVIIVEDCKNVADTQEHALLISTCNMFPNINITILEREVDSWNPAPAYNQGAETARGDYLIITNPECVHVFNVLEHLDRVYKEDNRAYAVCACLAVPKLQNLDYVKSAGQWYQHSVHRNVGLHFCSCIATKIFWEIGGFDEAYAEGVCFEDDDFRNKIISVDIPFIYLDECYVIHLAHRGSKPKDFASLHRANKIYYEKKWAGWCKAEDMLLK